jgi:uncharacterized protein YecE (DUF72 family)
MSEGVKRGRLYAGTSGFSYKEWKGNFYPEGLKDKEMLAHYSKVLSSVEINYTFRQMPSEAAIAGWKEQSQEGFTLTLKAPQRITHVKRLKEVGADVDEFVRRARGLGDRLGVIFFQLPPSARFDRERLTSFLATLPPVARFAMEFRHESWNGEEVDALLRENNVARCGVDWDDAALDSIPLVAGHAYMRLRKEDYSDSEIAAWAKKVSAVMDSGADVYCYFKHEGGGVAPKFATALKEAVE